MRNAALVALALGGLAAGPLTLMGCSGGARSPTKAHANSASAPARSASAVAPATSSTTHSSGTVTAKASSSAITSLHASNIRTSSTATAKPSPNPAGHQTQSTPSHPAPSATRAPTPAGSSGTRVASVNDRAELHLVHTSGETLDEEGQAQGALPGSIHAQLRVGATFSGTMVFSTQNGQIEASGAAQPRRGQGPIETFAGTAHITGGSGRYGRAHGAGGFSGSFNRRTYTVVLQTRGSFSY